jgi:hypothetical protein
MWRVCPHGSRPSIPINPEGKGPCSGGIMDDEATLVGSGSVVKLISIHIVPGSLLGATERKIL